MRDLNAPATRAAEPVPEHEVAQYLTFLAGGERFAVGILDAQEIIEVGCMTSVPMTPEYIRGVINLRGAVVPVIDLSARLGRGPSEVGKRSCIVLAEVDADGERQTLGMLVDEVNEILEIGRTDIRPPPSFGSEIRTDFIQAMGQVGDEFIILLEIDRVLSVAELAQLEHLGQTGASAP